MPKKIALTTDWVTVGTAGPTVDGRTIPDQLLEQAAANYDADEYCAVINSDHLLSWYGNFGTVAALRTAKDKKQRTVLQAKLSPNKRLLEMNSQGQRLFMSMELEDNYAETDEGYLTGLALTDQPASLGTTQLQFSKGRPPSNYCSVATEFTLNSTEGEVAMEGLFKRFLASLNPDSAASAAFAAAQSDNSQTEEEEPMNKEQFQQLLDSIKGLEQKFSTHGSQLNSGNQPGDGNGGSEGSGGEEELTLKGLFARIESLETQLKEHSKEGGDTAGQEQGSSDSSTGNDSQNFKLLADSVADLTTKFNAMLQERPGSQTPAGDGDAGSTSFV